MDSSVVHATVDRLLLEQGEYAPVEFLLASGRLPYSRYEAWRCGELEFLEEGLAGHPERVRALLEAAAGWARRLGLTPRVETPRGWGPSGGKTLRLARDAGHARLLGTHYLRPPATTPQMDLFLDSGPTMVLNDLVTALNNRDPDGAAARLEALLTRYPGHRQRAFAESLCDALLHLQARGRVEPERELRNLQSRLEPAAQTLLGHRARDFLAPFWRRLGVSLEGLPFDPAWPDGHASYAYARCFDWQAVYDSVLREPDPLSQPVLLARLALACRNSDRRQEAIRCWCELCWRHPARAPDVLADPDLPDSAVRRAWQRFMGLDAELAVPWFPAVLLIGEPGLARGNHRAWPAPDLAPRTAPGAPMAARPADPAAPQSPAPLAPPDPVTAKPTPALPPSASDDAGPAPESGDGSPPRRAFTLLRALLAPAAPLNVAEELALRRALQALEPALLALYLER